MSSKLSMAVSLTAILAAGCAGLSDKAPVAPATSAAVPVVPGPLVPQAHEDAQAAALAYRLSVLQLPMPQNVNERNRLVSVSGDPGAQLRLALLLAQPRTGNGDLARALALADGIVKSTDPAAQALRPLAALLAEQLLERQRLEQQVERQATQLRDSQRRVGELQEKLERLANIERSLPGRPLPAGRTP